MENYNSFLKKSQEVYSWFSDDQSKKIFSARMGVSVCNDNINILSLVRLGSPAIVEALSLFEKSVYEIDINPEETVIIYGAGEVGHKQYQRIKENYGCTVVFCDQNHDKLQGKLEEEVISVDMLLRDYSEHKIIICCSYFMKEAYDQLIGKGIEKNRLFFGAAATDEEQYFEPVVTYGNEEVFLDCGTFDGTTTIQFSKNCPNYKKVYCFEPDSDNYSNAENNFKNEGLENVVIIDAGVWKRKDVLKFSLGENQGSARAGMIADCGEIEVPVVSIDDVLDGEPCTFIKMDIEGAELDALIGAEKTILEYKPKLAISLYHKPEDILEIPTYLKSLVPEYQLYLRHYTGTAEDTVLYAIPN